MGKIEWLVHILRRQTPRRGPTEIPNHQAHKVRPRPVLPCSVNHVVPKLYGTGTAQILEKLSQLKEILI
jgi:hypothetical protein